MRVSLFHFALVLLGVVTADHAAGRGAEKTVAVGVMTSNAADEGALDAALGESRRREQREGEGYAQAGKNFSHGRSIRCVEATTLDLHVRSVAVNQPAV